EEVLLELGQGELRVHRHAVVEEVEVQMPEVHHLLALRVFDPGLADIPLAGDGPVEDLRAGRDLVDCERDALPYLLQGLAHTVAGDAAADRIEVRDEAEHVFAWSHGKKGRFLSRSEITATGSGQGMANVGSSQR